MSGAAAGGGKAGAVLGLTGPALLSTAVAGGGVLSLALVGALVLGPAGGPGPLPGGVLGGPAPISAEGNPDQAYGNTRPAVAVPAGGSRAGAVQRSGSPGTQPDGVALRPAGTAGTGPTAQRPQGADRRRTTAAGRPTAGPHGASRSSGQGGLPDSSAGRAALPSWSGTATPPPGRTPPPTRPTPAPRRAATGQPPPTGPTPAPRSAATGQPPPTGPTPAPRSAATGQPLPVTIPAPSLPGRPHLHCDRAGDRSGQHPGTHHQYRQRRAGSAAGIPPAVRWHLSGASRPRADHPGTGRSRGVHSAVPGPRRPTDRPLHRRPSVVTGGGHRHGN